MHSSEHLLNLLFKCLLFSTLKIFFTECLSGLSKMSYRDRLKVLSLPPLEVTRLTADLIFCYKIISGLVS